MHAWVAHSTLNRPPRPSPPWRWNTSILDLTAAALLRQEPARGRLVFDDAPFSFFFVMLLLLLFCPWQFYLFRFGPQNSFCTPAVLLTRGACTAGASSCREGRLLGIHTSCFLVHRESFLERGQGHKRSEEAFFFFFPISISITLCFIFLTHPHTHAHAPQHITKRVWVGSILLCCPVDRP